MAILESLSPIRLLGATDVISTLTDAVCRFRPDGTFTFVNDAYCRLFGKSADTLIGTRWQPQVHPDDLVIIEARLREITLDHPVVTIENRVYIATGELRWLQFINCGLFDATGQLQEIQSSGRDITTLKESELRYRALVEASSEVVYQMSPDWTVMVHLTGQDFIPNTDVSDPSWVARYIPVDEQERVNAAIAEAIADKQMFNLIHRVLTVDGDQGWVHSRAVPILDAAGNILEWFGMAKDVTSLWRAKKALRENEVRYRALVETTSVVTWHCPPDGLHVAPQPAWMAFTGQTAEEMLGAGWAKVVHPDDVTQAAAVWNEAVAQGKTFFNEHRIRRHDGEWRWMRVRAVPVRDEQEQITAWMGMGQDSTDEKEDELRLRESEKHLANQKTHLELCLTIANLVDWAFDLVTGTLEINQRIKTVLGRSPGELASRAAFGALLDPRDEAKTLAAFNAHLAGDSELLRCEYRLRHKDGHWVTVESVGKVIERDPLGNPLRMIGVIRDVTASRRLENESKDLLQRVTHLIHESQSELNIRTPDLSGLDSLSPREREVLSLIANGLTSPQIGRLLNLTVHTIVSHRKSLMSKLNVHNIADLIRIALAAGLDTSD